MPTDGKLFETIEAWQTRDAARRRTKSTDTLGSMGALQALDLTRELIESLTAGRWHMITTARLEGATWDEIARAIGHDNRPDALRNEYARLVEWYETHPSISVEIDRWKAAV